MAIARTVMGHKKEALNPKISPRAVNLVATSTGLVNRKSIIWTNRNNRLPGAFLYPNGMEIGVFQIDWAHFSNKEIASAIHAFRPNEIPEPQRRRGRGGIFADWRAKLESLALLRLRSCYTFKEAQPFLLQLTQSTKTKDAGECNREARKAADHFHQLFPFLPSNEKPRSWRLK
jgi:hypothetical protein